MQLTAAGTGGGFLHTYKAYCNYWSSFENPVVMQFVLDSIDTLPSVLDFSRCPGSYVELYIAC
jgi:hypothetical protein